MAAGDLITVDGQIEWAGQLLGSGTAYRWLELTGWEDSPGLDRGAVLRPARHGAWPGRDYAQERIITWDARITAPRDWQYAETVTTLRRITAISDSDEDAPLVIRTKGETLLVYGRVTQRIIPNTIQDGIGRGTAAIQWICSDPRRYSVAEHQIEIPQPSPGSGLTYPLIYPLDWGAGADSGVRQVTNAGDAATSPIITLTGPCETPAVVNVTNGQTIELGLTVGAAEAVVIDTEAGTVLLGAADRLFALTGRSVPPELFTLPAGVSELAFRAGAFTGGATCTVSWRDAYL